MSDMESYSIDLPLDTAAEQLTVEQAIANLRHEDTSLRYYAAWWLGRFQIRESAAVEALIEALSDEDDRTELGGYPLRRNAARALGKLNDQRAVPSLIECLNCDDFYVREAAAQSLGALGDRRAIAPLMALIADGLTVADRVPGQPHLVQPCEAVIEALGALQANEAVDLLRPFLQAPTERVRYAATRSMYQLTGEAEYGEQLVEALNGRDLQLRRVALSDLGAVGYMPSADAIAQAAVESSFKLFSLKGLLDADLRRSGFSEQRQLSGEARHVMSLMDDLL